MRALVVGADDARGTLAATRALAAAGWQVGVGSPHRHGLAASSAHAARWHRVPGPGEESFVTATAQAMRDGGYAVVLPGGDVEALALSAGRDRLPGRVPYGSHASVELVLDKLTMTAAAEAAGVAVPRTRPAGQAGEIPLPAVVKPRRRAAAGPIVCRHAAAASAVLAPLGAAGAEPVVQVLVPSGRGRRSQ
jgi:predicted ATP-grasp superfamily ATP-dependent carboligase